MLCAVLFISPLVAGKLAPIPNLTIQGLIFTAALLFMRREAQRESPHLPGRRISILAVVFFALLVLSAVTSVCKRDSVVGLTSFGSYLLAFTMAVSLRKNRKAIYALLASLTLSAMIVGALGLEEYMLTRVPGWRVFSTFFNPDYLAGFMALMLPLALAWYFSETSLGVTVVSGLSVLFILGALLLTGSRFGFLAGALGVFVFAILALRAGSIRKPQLVRAMPVVLLALVVLAVLGKPLIARVGSVKAESHSLDFRLYTWKGAARMAAAHPLTGTGIGTFDVAYPKYASVGYTTLAHNTYLQIAAEAGPAATVALLLLLAASAVPPISAVVRRSFTQNPSVESESFEWMPDAGLMLSGLIAGAVASMARNLVDSDWYVTVIGIEFWVVLGAAISLAGDRGARRAPMTNRRFTIEAGILMLGIVSVLSMLAGESYLAYGESAMRDGDPDAALESYKQAAQIDFLNSEPHRRMGKIHLMIAQSLCSDVYAIRAEDELMQAISLEPTSSKNYYQLGRVYEHYPRNDQAIGAFRKALDADPNSPQVLLALAERYDAAGRNRDALDVYRRMVGVEESPYERVKAIPEWIEPAYIFAHAALARDFERRGDATRAAEEYNRALDRIRRYEDSIETIGPILESVGRRNPEIDDKVEAAKAEITERIGLLTADKRR